MRKQRLVRNYASAWFRQWDGMLVVASEQGRSDAVILAIDGDSVTLLSRSRGTTTRDLDASADDAGIQQLARLIIARGDLGRLLLLRLPPAQVLHKQLTFPTAARHDLEQIIGFAIDRETPFTRDDIYWSYVTRRTDSTRGQVEVDLFLVPRNSIDPWLAAARNARLVPYGIEVDTAANATTVIPFGARKDDERLRSQRSLVLLTATACILAAVAVALPFIGQQWALSSADKIITSLTEPAREASALRRAADQLGEVIAALKVEQDRNGSALAALAAATNALPDESYVTALNLKAGRLTMTGLSPSAAHLIEALAQTPGFREPAFDAPVVESEHTGLEAFTITVNVTAEVGS
jgi:general secretion pathway protein L